MTEITCIVCPMGCRINVAGAAPDFVITGQNCRRGAVYARNEMTEPRRMVTAVVAITGNKQLLPVKTASPIPKDKISAAMKEIRRIRITPPVQLGQIIGNNIAGTGIPIIATKNVT